MGREAKKLEANRDRMSIQRVSDWRARQMNPYPLHSVEKPPGPR